MAGITSFITKGEGTHGGKRKDRFEKIIKGKSQKEIRKIEEALLKPQPIPKYIGPKTGLTDFLKRTIEITFDKIGYIERLSKFIKVGNYLKNNTYDTKWLVELIRLMEEGRLHWNRREGKYYFKEGVGRRTRL